MKKKEMNRRDFLRLTATAGAGVLVAPQAFAMSGNSEQDDTPEIPLRTLGRTGIKVPILSMGVMRADNPSVVRAAYNSGIFHFDTANGYQNGRNEEMLGNFFEGKERDSFCIATKVKTTFPLKEDFEEKLNSDLDTSLRRLKMDYVDIFYIHDLRTEDNVTNTRVVEALRKIKEAGKARYIGFSSHVHKPGQLDAAIEAGIYDIALISFNFKLANLKETEEAVERAAKAGIGIVAMKTMTGGVEDSTGKKQVDAQACLRWVWSNDNIATAIPGFSNYDQFDDCLAAAQAPAMKQSDLEYIAALSGCEGLYCQQCGKCLAQCPEQVPVPDIMRAYMYTYGYKFPQLSKETLAELKLDPETCSNCTECKVKCTAGFDVAAKIAAIRPVMDVPDVFLG